MASFFPISIRHRPAWGYRSVLLAYTCLFLALIFPFWLGGEIVAPYRLNAEIAASDNTASTHIENKKFSDYWNVYVPEVDRLFKARRSGWLALWTDQNELGRPLYHTSGFSPAYAPTWVISLVTGDPQRLITVVSLGNCFLAGLFVLLLCRELSLAPLAGLVSGGSVAASPLFMYWLTFPMFLAVWCWSAGVLFAMTRLARKVDLFGSSILAFSVYSLLLTAYSQPAVFHAYILAGYGLRMSYCLWRSAGLVSAVRYIVIAVISIVIGGLLTLPVYLDLAHTLFESARVAPHVSFFTAVLPKIDSLTAAIRIFVLSTFPEVLGNPIAPSYPFPYDGLSVTPLIIFLVIFGLSQCWREAWGWWLPIGALGALAFIHPLYALAVNYMGFNLSRSNPIGTMMLPMIMISAYSADALVKREPLKRSSQALMRAGLGTLACLFIALYFGFAHGVGIRWSAVLATAVVVCLLVAQINLVRPALLVLALMTVGAFISFPLMLRQPSSQITETSPLIQKVIANVPPDSRFAIAAPGFGVLPPNLNALFEVASIHSYNSLSSRRYHDLVAALGGEVQTYGRWNGMISPAYETFTFWMSNVSLVLSPTKLAHSDLESIGEEGQVWLYRVNSRMGCCLQIESSFQKMPDGIELHGPTGLIARRLSKSKDEGDLMEFDVGGDSASLLVLSQKFHRDWRADVLTSLGWANTQALPVNGVFQGVILPAGAKKARLQFVPFVRFAWIAHIFWLTVLIALAAQALRLRLNRLTSSEEPR